MNIDTSSLLKLGGSADSAKSNESAPQALQRIADANKHDNDRAAEVYAAYQKNIQTSSSVRSEILQGIFCGVDSDTLVLKAAKVIGAMCDDNMFYNQVEQALITVRGEGFGERAPLKIRLENVRKRLESLKKAKENTPNDAEKRLLQRAIEEHEREVQRLLKSQIDERSTTA